MNQTLMDVIRALNLTAKSSGAPAYQGEAKVAYRGRTVQLSYILITSQDLPHDQTTWEKFLIIGLLERSLDIAGCFIDIHRGWDMGPMLLIQTQDAPGLFDRLRRMPYDDERFQELAFPVWQRAYGSSDQRQWLREYALEAGMRDLLGDELEPLWGMLLAERPWLINDHPLMAPLVAIWQQQAEALVRQLFSPENTETSS